MHWQTQCIIWLVTKTYVVSDQYVCVWWSIVMWCV